MANPERGRAQPTLEAAANSLDEHELLRSLNKLALSTSPTNSTTRPSALRISSSPTSNEQANHTAQRLSSVSPSARAPSRSPVGRVNSSGFNSLSRSSTPTLLRKTSMNSLHSSNGIAPSRAPSRRSSSNHLSPIGPRSPRSPFNLAEFKEKPIHTASSVARTYMKKELELLHGESTTYRPETIVILNDACYGHRYSRPRATKGDLNSIVERPERIQASVFGISMAYVRLGERHCDGKYPLYPELDPLSLPNVPFHIRKTDRTLALDSAAVTNVHGTKWMEELKIMCESAESKLAVNTNELRRPDMNRGSNTIPQELHKGDLYLCSESLNAFEGALGAVCEAVDGVFNDSPYKRAFVAVRPPGHHCSASHPSGFCWVNNVHVGIMHGFMNHGLTHAAIIDFDLHHGDGSQAIAWDHNKRSFTATKNMSAWKRTSIGYFSLHDINSYPCEYGDDEKVRNASVCVENAHGQSIWNVHLQEWKSDVEFWKLYQSKYLILLEKARSYLRTQTERYRASGQKPKAVIFVSAGFDASEWESAGMQRHKVNVPTEFYARLTRDVVKLASEEGLGVDGRVISVLEGGYSDRAIYSGVLSHLSGLAGDDSSALKEDVPTGLNYEMGGRVSSLSRRNTLTGMGIAGFPYDPKWWSGSELDQFDAYVSAPPKEPPKKPRTFVPGNYSSPTQASSAKAVDPTKVRRSMSGYNLQLSVSRPPTPPLPDVPWTAAAHELSKLLIPSDRVINSYKFEELNAGAKAKRERQSLPQSGSTSDDAASVISSATAPVRKSQRERKPVKYTEIDEPKITRRKTVGSSTILATEKALARGIPTQNGSGSPRNLSAAVAMGDASSAVMRPTTSHSIRPESSMSVRTQASTALNVRRTRPGAPIKKESTRAPRKTRIPDVKMEGASQPPRKESTVSVPEEPAATAKDSTADIENITGGMKRIKINVLTKEKKEARQRAEAEEKARRDNQAKEELSKTEGTRLSDSANGIYPSLPVTNGSERKTTPPLQPKAVNGDPRVSKLGTGLSKVLPLKPETERSNSANVPTTILTPAEPDQLQLPSSPPAQVTPEAEKTIAMQNQRNGQLPDEAAFSSPVRVPEPITSPPAQQNGSRLPTLSASSVPSSPARNGGHGFTSTSNIPFAPQSAQKSRIKPRSSVPAQARPRSNGEGKEENVWEIPEAPQRF
ncbi:Arginase/deacetylase [Daldinia bambusicola]|nr:Arginase/deacetylase [Daldinia bambusicola]